jgi:hypothetical protein
MHETGGGLIAQGGGSPQSASHAIMAQKPERVIEASR